MEEICNIIYLKYRFYLFRVKKRITSQIYWLYSVFTCLNWQ